jgi:hypothetical protein
MRDERELACFAAAIREIYYRNSREEWSTEKHSTYINALLLVAGNFGYTSKEVFEYLIDDLMINPEKYHTRIGDA